MQRADVVVVGGGAAGQAAALTTARAGLDTVLLDDGAPRVPGVRVQPGRVAWTALPGFTVETVGPSGRETWSAPRLIAATGRAPVITPFPGWTLPGVAPLGGERSGARLRGRRIVVVGAPIRDRRVVAVTGRVLRAEGDGQVERVKLDGGWVQADAVALTVGAPRHDLERLLGASSVFDGAWQLWTDGHGRTTVPGLYSTGTGAVAAAAAARSCLRDAVGGTWPAMQAHTAGHVSRSPRDAPADDPLVICPCEELTRAEIEAAIAAGARSMNQLRSFTRCGMGACQGALCREGAALLLAAQVGPEAAGQWTQRPPLRPVPLAALLGAFTYADIPVPPPAPL